MKKGVVVNGIEPGAPASSSDLRAGDIILKIDNAPVGLSREVQREILSKKVGQRVQLELWRNGKVAVISLNTGEQPERMTRASNRRARTETQVKPGSPTPNYGLTIEDVPPDVAPEGVIVREIAPGSAADAAGLVVGDVITDLAGKPLKGKADFETAMTGADLKRGIMLLINRDGQRTFAILKP